jgi:hypothetical protein
MAASPGVLPGRRRESGALGGDRGRSIPGGPQGFCSCRGVDTRAVLGQNGHSRLLPARFP